MICILHTCKRNYIGNLNNIISKLKLESDIDISSNRVNQNYSLYTCQLFCKNSHPTIEHEMLVKIPRI